MQYPLFSDEYFMNEALKEAKLALEKGEIPVGAVVVANQQIIARGHNSTEELLDVTAHAEILAITSASNNLGSKYLQDCTLYVTLEPCPMCASATSWAQLGKIIYGTKDPKAGYSLLEGRILHPKTEVTAGVLESECSALLSDFFKKKRGKN
ncbi:MAG: nucleoside deaminase [Bacteroidales bacterium]